MSERTRKEEVEEAMFTCPSVKREVAGKTVELRLDFNAVALVEQMTGKNLLDAEIWREMDTTTITAVYWAAAVQCNPKATLSDVRAGGFKDAAEMVQAVRAAWKASSGAPEEDERPTNGSKEPASAEGSAQ